MGTQLLAVFGSSFLIALSGAMMPGPLLSVTISESIQKGAMAGPRIVAGHALLEIALIAALVLGLAPFLADKGVFAVIALGGALVLLWMAFGMFRSLPKLSLDLGDMPSNSQGHVLAGITMSLANPYWVLWWATIGLGYVLYCRQFGIAGIVFFFSGHILADFLWYGLISLAMAKGRHLLSNHLYQALIGVCAGALVFFSGYFAYTGLRAFIT
jgi:threonine/homoserine/homoserine lactone efflux protein